MLIDYYQSMSPIIITKCKCSDKKVYISIEKEKYFKDRIKDQNWELEYSKRVKEENTNITKKILRKRAISGLKLIKYL